MSKMIVNCVHVVRDLDESSGGPSRSITQTVLSLAKAGCECHIVTQNRGNKLVDISSLDGNVKIHWLSKRIRLSEFKAAWNSSVRPGRTVVHVQGLWSGVNHLACHAARQDNIPYIIAPRGMLASWAINHKKWKKKVAYWLYQRNDLARASRIHSTSSGETESIGRLGLSVNIEEINNAVDVPVFPSTDLNGVHTGTRKAIFLGRLHPVKGLENLIKAWSKVSKTNWKCWIVGPGESYYVDKLQRLAIDLDVASTIEIRGGVSDFDKWQLLRSANLAVQPSHSENFGMAIAESLGCALPVITTRNTPWQDLVSNQCGWWIEDNVDALIVALEEALSLSDAERWAMGNRGMQLIRTKYCWDAAVKRMICMYYDLIMKNKA